MKKRKFGNIGWDVSEISLGCWAMGADWGDVSEENAKNILKNANIANFIALNNEDYINKAVYYANNIDKLEDVRKELFEEIEKSSIFDTTGFSGAFCKALNDMILDVNKNYR
mgnify:CR=1 FL=1